ncbi:MAG: zinc-ribbon domain-containing protein [Desulfovibrionaceae bacterium]|jgi:predicted Zn finger-like uncharacterized protein|nr:zinc-ribbon domain-containing protein [Desulfovibrionaceae bacterium]
MGLVTRCPACSTLFRLVPDQIRIAAGWVRCGQCGKVFDASVHMLPYDQTPRAGRQAPPPPLDVAAHAPAGSDAPNAALEGPPSEFAPTEKQQLGKAFESEPPDAGDDAQAVLPVLFGPSLIGQFTGAPDVADWSTTASESEQAEPLEDDASETDSEPASQPGERASEPGAPPSDAAPGMADGPVASALAMETGSDADQPVPSFVARARQRAFWSSRPVRRLQWLSLSLLTLSLLWQVTLSHRDWLAARAPRLTPALQALCAPLRCRIQPYRQPNAIVIDDKDLTSTDSGSFRFSVTLRNTASLPVASPALELTLTDAWGHILARRVVTADELGAPPTLAAHGKFTGIGALTVSAAANPGAITGYLLDAFYP